MEALTVRFDGFKDPLAYGPQLYGSIASGGKVIAIIITRMNAPGAEWSYALAGDHHAVERGIEYLDYAINQAVGTAAVILGIGRPIYVEIRRPDDIPRGWLLPDPAEPVAAQDDEPRLVQSVSFPKGMKTSAVEAALREIIGADDEDGWPGVGPDEWRDTGIEKVDASDYTWQSATMDDVIAQDLPDPNAGSLWVVVRNGETWFRLTPELPKRRRLRDLLRAVRL